MGGPVSAYIGLCIYSVGLILGPLQWAKLKARTLPYGPVKCVKLSAEEIFVKHI